MKPNGFILLGCLAFLPLLLSLALGFSLWSLVLQETGETLHFCRETLLAKQKELLIAIAEVVRMNPEARALRQQRKIAELNLKMAMVSANPGAIAKAQVNLQAVVTQQMLFRSRQLRVVSQYQLRLHSSGEWARQLWLRKFQRSRPKLSIRAPQMALEESPPGELSPDYLPVRNFEDKQAFQLRWKHSHPALELISKNRLSRASAISACATTIYRSEKQWKTSLISVDKF